MARIQNYLFSKVHGSQLIYNTCWEDPRIDRELLGLNRNSRLVMITSAGCNAMEYLLDDPKEIHCVDLNYRQNALLELKMAVFARCDYEDVFQWFGRGHHPKARAIYGELREGLSPTARSYWDKRISYFENKRFLGTFYYRGASGLAAWLMKHLMFQIKPKVRYKVMDLIEAKNLDEQKQIYDDLEPQIWNRMVDWLVKHPMLMTMVGVPAAQINLINRDVEEGLYGFIRSSLRRTFTELVVSDNYFWRVYIMGCYRESCCPEYLKAENFGTIRSRLDRLSCATDSLSGYIEKSKLEFSQYILLDHQDWLAWYRPDLLEEEWTTIRRTASDGARVLMRSAGLKVDFCEDYVKDWLSWKPGLTEALHGKDRVGTYGSLHLGVV